MKWLINLKQLIDSWRKYKEDVWSEIKLICIIKLQILTRYFDHKVVDAKINYFLGWLRIPARELKNKGKK